VHIEDVVSHIFLFFFVVCIAGYLLCFAVLLVLELLDLQLGSYGYKTHDAVLFDSRLGAGPGYFGGRGAWTADDEARADGLSGW